MSRVLAGSTLAFVPGFDPPGRPERIVRSGTSGPPANPASGAEEDDRPPVCPICSKRLVILAMHPGRDADGRPIRRQLWGCPRGHVTAYRVGGVFGPFDILDDLDDE